MALPRTTTFVHSIDLSTDWHGCGCPPSIRALLDRSEPDPTMSGALPPGAWWITANQGVKPAPAEPYGPHAGLAAVHAAREGPLELDAVSFNYPLRPNMRGGCPHAPLSSAMVLLRSATCQTCRVSMASNYHKSSFLPERCACGQSPLLGRVCHLTGITA